MSADIQYFHLMINHIHGREILTTPYTTEANTGSKVTGKSIDGRGSLHDRRTPNNHDDRILGFVSIMLSSREELGDEYDWGLRINARQFGTVTKPHFSIYLPKQELDRYHSMAMHGGLHQISVQGHLNKFENLHRSKSLAERVIEEINIKHDIMGTITYIDIQAIVGSSGRKYDPKNDE